jgi:hypothetical protein
MRRLLLVLGIVCGGCAARPSIVESPRALTESEENELAERVVDSLRGDDRLGAALDPNAPSLPAILPPRHEGSKGVVGPMCIYRPLGLGKPPFVSKESFDGCPKELTLILRDADDEHSARVEVWVQRYETVSCVEINQSPQFMSSRRCKLGPDGGPSGDAAVAAEVDRVLRAILAGH